MKRNKTPLDELATLLKNPPHNLSVNVYNEDEKIKKESSVKKSKAKYTLTQIGDALFNFVNYATNEFKQLNIRIDKVETRLDKIDARLDYNNLKKLPDNYKAKG